MRVEKILPRDWSVLSENAHKIAFGKIKPASTDRIDYALLAVEDETPLAYVTVREIDSETVYWQFGGSMPGAKDTILSFRSYQKFVEYCRENYKRVTTLIENTNLVMMKMAMKVGFRIIGVRTFDGSILLEHLLEFEKEIPNGC